MNTMCSASDTATCYRRIKQGSKLRRVGMGFAILNRMFRRYLTTRVICEQRTWKRWENITYGGRTFQAEGAASAKHLSGREPAVLGGYWWGQCGTGRMGKEKRWDQKIMVHTVKGLVVMERGWL